MPLSAPIYTLKRHAKLLARDARIPLHEALDRVAQSEGFASWSLLSSKTTPVAPSLTLSELSYGDTVLIAARPGQGKTRLALRLLLDAAREGRQAAFFTLEYTSAQAVDLMRSIAGQSAPLPWVETSDDIDARFIIERLEAAPAGSVAVIDYLQLLDQRRDKPPLFDQLEVLKTFARQNGVILVFLSQVDRAFNAQEGALPSAAHLRLPNAAPADTFSKAGFLHAGKFRLDAA